MRKKRAKHKQNRQIKYIIVKWLSNHKRHLAYINKKKVDTMKRNKRRNIRSRLLKVRI